jgi:hypothetical protein
MPLPLPSPPFFRYNKSVALPRLTASVLILLLLLSLIPRFAHAQVALEDIDWETVDEKTKAVSRYGTQALGISSIPWKHAQTEHFVYHFVTDWLAERAAAEAETYYALIKKDLKVETDQWELKGHIFIFETAEAWQQFIQTSAVDRWSGGVCIGNEFFLKCEPGPQPFTGSTLPHEMVHLIINRFVRGQIPIWLNEGIAEQQSRKHYVGYTKPKGFNFLLRPNVVSEANYTPLAELTAAQDYPADEAKVPHFYTQSVRLVQFLVEDHPQQNFLEFLQYLADGLQFDSAFDRVYGQLYPSLEIFEVKFKEKAIATYKLVE